MKIIRELLKHDVHPSIQFVKYAISGGLATGTHIALFQLCGWLVFPCLQEKDLLVKLFDLDLPLLTDTQRAWHAILCNTIGFMISNFVAYLLNILFVFKPGRHNKLVELGLFYLVSGVSFVLGSSLMGLMIKQFSVRTDIAFISNIVMSLAINFIMRKMVIFKG